MRPKVVTEHATQYSGGSMLVWNERPEILQIFPLAERIAGEQQHGKVWQRKIIVLQGWTEVPKPAT